MRPAEITLLADHSLLDTAPFFLPAFLVVGVVVALMIVDRRRQRREVDDGDGDGAPSEDGPSGRDDAP